METLIQGVIGMGQEPGRIVMMLIGGLLMYLGIKKEYEPTLLVPMGLGTILVNFPNSGVLSAGGEPGPFNVLFDFGIKTELFPLLLFIGIGAMIDFGPLLQNPFMLMFGAAAQFGIFFIMAVLLGFDLNDAASIGIIGAADGPTSIFVANTLHSKYMGAIMVAAYSYMALVPIIQPVAIKAVTTKAERRIRMTYRAGEVSQTAKILFPVVITIVAGLIAPVLMVIGLGLVAFIMDSVGGVLFAKFLNLFRKEKINPMIGAAGISAFPMSSRVIQKMATDEDPQNFILMHAAGANVSGQIASVIAGGLLLAFLT